MRGKPYRNDESLATDEKAQRLWDIWDTGNYLGATKPFGRVTIQAAKMTSHNSGNGLWHNLVFNQSAVPVELPNVRSITIERAIDQDAASCRVVLYNTAPLPMGTAPNPYDKTVDQPGYYSYNRGDAVVNRWAYDRNAFADLIVPGRVLRTYQGYGVDSEVCPDLDENLLQTGTWLIDDVEFSAHPATITLVCRDLAALLLDQICFPPVVTLRQYPLRWEPRHPVRGPSKRLKPTSDTDTVPMRWRDDSNSPWIGRGASLYGHRGEHAFDKSASTYWLSIGNSGPSVGWAFEWIEGKLSSTDVDAVVIDPWAGNYVVYLSVYANGAWQGSSEIPYDEGSAPAAPNGANINYVKKTTIGSGRVTIKLPRTYSKVTRLRVTLTKLHDSNLGTFQYRGGIRFFGAVRTEVTPGRVIPGKVKIVGNYSDYTDIVKYLCGIAGFYWPAGAIKRLCDGTAEPSGFIGKHDPIVRIGRLWGDFEKTGTTAHPDGNPDDLTTQFDKRPLMDAINYIADIVGYLFFVDEEGSAVFRSPNIWKPGNFVPATDHTVGIYTWFIPTIDEKKLLKQLGARISSRNLRERVLVGAADDQTAAAADGQQTKLGRLMQNGMTRVGIYSDTHFASKKECQIMADLIYLRQMLTYRADQVVIPANPYLQPDDQVRIFERTTGESYLHYISAISHTWDAESGAWDMTLTTTWLGEKPYAKWVFDPNKLSAATREYLAAMKKIKK